MGYILNFILLISFFIPSAFAYEETCLAGDTVTYTFSSNQLPENLSLPSTEFDSSLSACNKAVSVYDSLLDGNGQKYFSQVQFFGVQGSDPNLYCDIAYRKWGMTTEFQHDFVILNKNTTQKDCACPVGQTRNFSGQCVARCPSGSTWNGTKCVLTSCPVGQHVQGSTCVDDEELPDQCPDGYYRGDDNFCHKYEECAADEELVNGQCKKKDDEDDDDDLDICDSNSKFYFLCQWYNDWLDWWNDYLNNEEQAYSDRQDIKNTLDQVREQDSQFYQDIRAWLEGDNEGSPSGQFPIVQFPKFCDWSTVVCEWYLDYKEFTQEIRDFIDEYNENIDENANPLEVEEQPYEIKENNNIDLTTTHYIQGYSGCPADRVFPVSMGGQTIDIVISYRSLCDAAVMFKPFVILMSFIAGMMIITNTGRRAEVGD